MAASLLDQNSRSLFHKQRVRAFFSLTFFPPKAAAFPTGPTASRRLVSRERRSLKGLGGNFSSCFAFLSRTAGDTIGRAPRPQSQLLRSPSKPVTTITASNPGPIPRYWTIAWFTTHPTTQHQSKSFTFRRTIIPDKFSNVHSLDNVNLACKGQLRSSSSTKTSSKMRKLRSSQAEKLTR